VSTLSEAESKRLVADHGIPVVPDEVCADADSAVTAARTFGGSVAVKLTGPGLAHKTERGLVRLDVTGDTAVRSAAGELLAAARASDGDVALLVAPMLDASRELIAGVHRDDQFGPTVMLGIGGILAEAVADVAFRLAPLARIDALEMTDDLEHRSLLGPVRSEPPVDREALADVLVALSGMALDDGIVGVDLNPLLIVDGRPIAVDALVELR
jgi:acetyl-CoA synthetase (ADP-forming)